LRGDGTHDWRKIETLEQAVLIAKASRDSTMPSRGSPAREYQKPVPVNANFSGGNHHRNGHFHSTETITTGHSTETITTIDISGRGARASSQRRSADHEEKKRLKSKKCTSPGKSGSAGKLDWSTPELIEITGRARESSRSIATVSDGGH
jgi:hypothetical protein